MIIIITTTIIIILKHQSLSSQQFNNQQDELCEYCSLRAKLGGSQNNNTNNNNNIDNTNIPHADQLQQQPQYNPFISPAFQTHHIPPHAYNVVMTLSVRSALHAYLTTQNYPKGSIILFSALNIPDMARVIRSHGLIPLPIDIELDTTQINLQHLKKTIRILWYIFNKTTTTTN
eukprot:UN01799